MFDLFYRQWSLLKGWKPPSKLGMRNIFCEIENNISEIIEGNFVQIINFCVTFVY